MIADPARDQILRSIRENLTKSAPDVAHAPSDHGPPEPRVPSPEPPDLVERFTTQLEAVGAQWTLVRGEAEAARALRRILADAGARRVAGSDAALVARVLPERLMGGGLSREELFACDAGVTTAQWGIAETGTLVLESAREQHRLLSLVPPIHVALLSTRCICASLGDALARVSRDSHAITFITGPSRTSDIELTLVIGVHGPQTVHVLLLEDA
ncbi:MAG TPA: lactate utilization protein [Gemmatimonadales bacterium]|jgi:L-lactate dehydrogenase complex protein LldG|nr:lactate utilization protein [Gemmatimonadales bacterium]